MANSGGTPGRDASLKRLERKLQRDRTAILTDTEVTLLSQEVRTAFAESSLPIDPPNPRVVDDLVRWRSLGQCCRQARYERGWGLRVASVVTQIPQYRIRAIEDGHLAQVRADLARRYFRVLGIGSWVERWVRANRNLLDAPASV